MIECVTEERIRWGDLDSLGIVFYPRYYEWIDACGHRFFEIAGIPFDSMWRKHKIIFGMVEPVLLATVHPQSEQQLYLTVHQLHQVDGMVGIVRL